MNQRKINVEEMITVKNRNQRKRNQDLMIKTSKNVHIVRRYTLNQVILTDILKFITQKTTLFHVISAANNSKEKNIF